MKRLLYLLLIPVLLFTPVHAQEIIEDDDEYAAGASDTLHLDTLNAVSDTASVSVPSLPWPQSVQASLASLLDSHMFST